MTADAARPASGGIGEAAVHGALLGVLLGIAESAAIAGAYWFELSGGYQMRAFAVAAVLLDATAGLLVAAVTRIVLGPRRGLPAAAFFLVFLAALAQGMTNFRGKLDEIGGDGAAVALAVVLGGMAVWSCRLPSRLPRGFHVRGRYLLLLLVALALVLLPERPARPTGAGPNVLVLVADTLRQDVLGHAGSLRAFTPHLDRLSRRGAVVEETVTASNSTPSSIASLLTGLEVRRHGLRGFGRILEARFLTMGEAFQERGYRTFGFSSSFPAHLAYHAFDQGLELRDDTSIPHHPRLPPWEALERLACLRLASRVGVGLPRNAVSSTREANLTVGRVQRLLERDGAEPFFGWVHLFDPHAPYGPPPWHMRAAYGDKRRIDRGDLDQQMALAGMEKPSWLRSPVNVKDAEFPVAAYHGEAAFVDEESARLLATLRSRGAAPRTIVAFVADHGEGMLEPRQKMLFNHDGLYENVVRVPLLLAGPGAPEGVVVGGIARTVDLMPTLLDLAGASVPEGLDGASLVPRLRGARAAPEELVFTEAPYGGIWAVRRGAMKLVRTHPDRPPALYDLVEDPQELHDLCLDRPEVAAALRVEVEQRLSGRGTAAERDLDEQQIERLRDIGYVERPGSAPQELPPGCGEAVS